MRTAKDNSARLGGRVASLDIRNGQDGYFGTVTIACDDGYFKKSNEPNGQSEWVDRTYFFDVKADSRFLKNFKPAIEVGDEVTLRGKLVQEKWTDNGGQNRSSTKIKAIELIQHLRKVEVECLKASGLIGNQNQQNSHPQQNSSSNYQSAPQHHSQQQNNAQNYQRSQQDQSAPIHYPQSQGGFAPKPQPGGYGGSQQ